METDHDDSLIREACRNRAVSLPDGKKVPCLGQGTWRMGDNILKKSIEIASLRRGIELGMTLIDTAEMYGEGQSELLVGEAIRGLSRQELCLVSKVYPHNAGEKHMAQSCENSLRRLGTDYLDLYLLHWRGGIPLAETVGCMEKLKSDGKIRAWGVSNFDTSDMKELWQVPDGGKCAVNQVLYHLGSRGIEFDLLPWMREHQVPLMAYCPIAQGGRLRKDLLHNPDVGAVAKKHRITVMQALLSFVLRDSTAIAIPKAGTPAHVQMNAETVLTQLDEEDLSRLSNSFPPPRHKTRLEIE